jgi:hypothetical protein
MVFFLNISNIKSYMHIYVHILHLLDNSRLASQHLVYTYCFLLLVTYLLDITLCHLITMTICRRVIAYRLDGWYSTSDRSVNFLFRHIQPASGATKNYQKVWAGFLLKGKKDGTSAWAYVLSSVQVKNSCSCTFIPSYMARVWVEHRPIFASSLYFLINGSSSK